MTNAILSETLLGKVALAVATWAAASNGPTFDSLASGGPHRRVLLGFMAQLGAGDTGDIILQSSPDDSTWTDIAGATFSFTVANSNGKILLADVSLEGLPRYIRARIENPISSPSGAAFWIATDSKKPPVTQTEGIMFAV